MGLPAINSLANMELMLYGAKAGLNSACPSLLNGYRGNSVMYNNMMGIYNNPYMNPYNFGFNPTFQGGSIYDSFTPSYGQQQTGNNVGFGASETDLNVLGNYYLEGLSPSESLMGAATGGVIFGAINNPRIIVHPWNSLKATFSTNKIFADVTKEGSELNTLWRKAGATNILQEAYARTHKLEALNNSKLGLFRKRIDKAEYDRLKKVMEDALKFVAPDEDAKLKKIAEATEAIKKATNAYTGSIPRGLRALGLQKPLTALRKRINPSQYKPIIEMAEENVAKEGAELTLGKSMAKSCGVGNGVLFAAFEFFNDLCLEKKIQKAFSKDSSTGWTQVGQTTVKGVSSAVGWAVGEGIGAWAGGIAAAKIGAIAGTTIAPGVGTVIGAVAGLVGGSIGMWLTGKITKKIIGQDVADKVEVENMKKTPEGQAQLLQLTVQQAQGDKKVDARTLQALQNVARVYGLA